MNDIEVIRQRIRHKQPTYKLSSNVFKNIKFNKVFSKILVTIIMFLALSITIKVYPDSKEFIYKNVFEKNFSFASVNKVYNKYLGKVLPVKSIFKEEVKPVFKEELVYSNKEKYQDGVKLAVTDNYLIPVIESGMVVFMGEKEGYGNTVIVQQINGIDTWYGNVNTTDIKLYQYIEKGSLLGEASKNLYLVFKKDGEVLDYNEYIK